jgi:hypothetical protein
MHTGGELGHSHYDFRPFDEEVLPSYSRQKRSDRRKKLELDSVVHIDNSMCHNARKISLELEYNKIKRALHPDYSPDISPCDLWMFDFLKEKLREQEPLTSDEIIETMTTIWNDVTFEELQSVLSEWIQRITWIIEYGGVLQ